MGFAGWTLDTTARHLISPRGVVVTLSGGEYRLLKTLLDHPKRVLSRDQLLGLTRGHDAGPFHRSGNPLPTMGGRMVAGPTVVDQPGSVRPFGLTHSHAQVRFERHRRCLDVGAAIVAAAVVGAGHANRGGVVGHLNRITGVDVTQQPLAEMLPVGGTVAGSPGRCPCHALGQVVAGAVERHTVGGCGGACPCQGDH